jgi:2-polyprenyl-3-methyl-5-hydroxy-6-metoxy-1,4-benzoquinol methylase
MHASASTFVEQCPLCQRPTGSFPVFAVANGWRYIKCPDCSLVFLNPIPTEESLSAYYNDAYNYDPFVYRDSVETQKGWLLGLIGKFWQAPAGRLLEIGCSYGFFLDAARTQGWRVEGIELSDRAATYARTELGLPVVGSTLSDLYKQRPVPYDVIVSWHVIEHLTDPTAFLREIAALVRPGGILALRTPNIDSAVAKLAGGGWEWLSAPDHIFMFSSRTLSRWLRSCGFEILLMQTRRGNASSPTFEILRSRLARLLRSRASGEGPRISAPPPRRFAGRRWYSVVRSIVETVSKPLDWFVFPWVARSGKEAELVVVARRVST